MFLRHTILLPTPSTVNTDLKAVEHDSSDLEVFQCSPRKEEHLETLYLAPDLACSFAERV